jgi:hypothetical protein
VSLSGGAPEPTEMPGATATAANPASPGGSVAESEQLRAMELALDQLASLIDTADFAFRSMPESIDSADDQEDFRAFTQDFERQLSLHLDVPNFPQNGPDWLQKDLFSHSRSGDSGPEAPVHQLLSIGGGAGVARGKVPGLSSQSGRNPRESEKRALRRVEPDTPAAEAMKFEPAAQSGAFTA